MSKPSYRLAFHTSGNPSLRFMQLRGLAAGVEETPELELIQIEGRADISMAQAAAAKPDALIATLSAPEDLATARAMKVPVVNIADHLEMGEIPSVISHNRETGRMVAEHFLHTGLAHFAFVGLGSLQNSMKRFEGFRDVIEAAGKKVHRLEAGSVKGSSWQEDCTTIARFLELLPKPVGVFCTGDRMARQALEAARSVGLDVPGEVAVAGTGNHEYEAILARPSLSTVPHRLDIVAHEAVRLIVKMLRGEAVPLTTLVTPRPLRVRGSSSFFYTDDAVLQKAMGFVARHYREPIGVDDVVRATGVSRRVLEKRFRTEKGTSVYAFLNETRLHHAKQLLIDTRLSVARIAEASGFREPRYLIDHLRKCTGLTPKTFRERERSPVLQQIL